MADVVAARAREASPAGARLSDALLVVMGHGTARDPSSAAAVTDVCARLAAGGEFGRVAPAFIDQEPLLERALAEATEPVVLLVPFLVAAGWHGGTTVPRELGLNGGAGAPRPSVIYAEPVGSHPRLIDVVEDALLAGMAGDAPAAPTMPEPADVDTPLRRAEAGLRARLAARGSVRMLEAHIRADARGYDLRHVADVDRPASELRESSGSDDLERLARTTDDQRHRPLRTAASLARGWRFHAPTLRDLSEALIALYGPATTHWCLGEQGDLVATSFAETAARQTGIYARLTTADPAMVEAGIRRTCDGLPCLRRRLWTAESVTPTGAGTSGAASGDLIVHCPEPCPVLLTSVLELLGGDEPESE
jgi:sirohydrochlorin cobaltochelatase